MRLELVKCVHKTNVKLSENLKELQFDHLVSPVGPTTDLEELKHPKNIAIVLTDLDAKCSNLKTYPFFVEYGTLRHRSYATGSRRKVNTRYTHCRDLVASNNAHYTKYVLNEETVKFIINYYNTECRLPGVERVMFTDTEIQLEFSDTDAVIKAFTTKDYSEKILCAAVYYNNKKIYTHQPINIKKGFVIAGYRHANCKEMFKIMRTYIGKSGSETLESEAIEGFLTSKNRFLTREEAAAFAAENQQLITSFIPLRLYSEDLY